MAALVPEMQAIFEVARKIDSLEAREAYLQQICGDDAAIGQSVRDLLAAYDVKDSFLEPRGASEAETEDAPGIEERPGEMIGPYKLLEQIGEGGFGVVFMAEQQQPVRRKVALKVIKPGMDSRQIIARFEAERQALALMDHPNIARVFDAGSTPTGRPYFVMELVKGIAITAYCDQNQLTPRERLELFVQVCQAVQHAHQKGIIHRDLKPSNVLVTEHDGTPVAKVIDFGIAKATGQQLTEKTLFTNFAQMIGTPLYLSPEQAALSGLDVDTRSDIYSLGVLLYELLTGETPFDKERFRQAAYDEVRRIIREEEPPKPSTRLSDSGAALASISAQRKTEPAKLSKLMRGELDWIVMKALEKDRNRRYETANGFAADVQRYLNDEPVQAGAPSAAYRLRKFARRNRGPVVAVVLVMVVLLVAILGTSWGLVRAEQGRMEAEKARNSEAEQREQAVANLYDSLVGEARGLRLVRQTGYREQSWQRLRQAARLNSPKRDLKLLRQEAAASLGDFVGLEPKIMKDFGKKLIESIALNPQATQLAIGFRDGTLSVRSLTDGVEAFRWTGHPGAAIHTVAFEPNGKNLASGAVDGTIVLWEASAEGGWVSKWASAIEPRASQAFTKAITLVFTPDGTQLAACSSGGSTIHFWRTEDGRPTAQYDSKDKMSGHLALRSDGTMIAASFHNNGEHGIRVWDGASGKVIHDFLPKIEEIYDVTFSPDGKMLACSGDVGIALFDMSTFQRSLHSLCGNIFALTFTLDNQLLAGGAGSTKVWNVVTNQDVATLGQPSSPEPSHADWVYSMALSTDGKTFISSSRNTIVTWNMAGASERLLVKRFAGGVPGAAFSPQGDLLASVSKDRTVTLWNPTTGQLVRSLTGCQGAVQAVAFSPDGRLLATGDWSRRESIRIWDVESGRTLVALDPQLGEVWSVAFSLDGQYFAAGGNAGWVIWKVDQDRARGRVGTGPLLQVMKRRPIRHSQTSTGATSVCFTPDGSLLAWVERVDLTFHLWDITASKERPAPLPRLGTFILSIWLDSNAVASLERGKWLWLRTPSGSEIWDMAAGQRICLDVLPREMDALPDKLKWGWCGAISPDRTKWAVGDGDGSLVLWDLAKVRARLEEAGLGWAPEPNSAELTQHGGKGIP